MNDRKMVDIEDVREISPILKYYKICPIIMRFKITSPLVMEYNIVTIHHKFINRLIILMSHKMVQINQ